MFVVWLQEQTSRPKRHPKVDSDHTKGTSATVLHLSPCLLSITQTLGFSSSSSMSSAKGTHLTPDGSMPDDGPIDGKNEGETGRFGPV
jgi:hypothetical protein